MKKIYALMSLAVAMSLSASASGLTARSAGVNSSDWTLRSVNDVKIEMPSSHGPLKATAKSSTRAEVSGSIEGVYYIEWYNSTSGIKWQDGGFEILVNQDGTTGTLASINSLGNLKVEIDEAAGTLSIPNQQIGDSFEWTGKDPDGNELTDNCIPVFQHYVINEEWNKMEKSDEPLVFVNNGNGIFVPKNGDRDVFNEYATLENHPQYQLSFTINPGGYYMTLYKYPEKLDNTDWVDLGDATVVDNFMTNGYQFSCPVQKSTKEEGVFRLVNPYGGLFSDVRDIAEGEIRFDVSCETAPMIMYGPSIYNGIFIEEVAPEYGFPADSPCGYFYSFTTFASDFYYSQDFEGDEVFTKEEIGEEFGEDECGSVKGNVITFAGLQSSISLNMNLYKWEDDADLYAKKFIITMPEGWNAGVNDIIADSNAPVKYYNLQGMEVANPEAGQLVIMKKGSKASKFIAK